MGEGGHFWIVGDNLFSFWWDPYRNNLFSFWWDPYRNEYAQDVLTNIYLHSAGRELPEDIVIVHGIRRQYWLFGQFASYIDSLFGFIERFGANTQELSAEMDDADRGRERSFEEFRDQRYEEALLTIRTAMAQLEVIEGRAFRLKDSTLLWVHLIQWATVTSALLISGVVLWTLMVRRRLFREVASTRLGKEFN